MSEWQPIETAPKESGDGPYWGKRGPSVLLTDGEGCFVGFWNGTGWDDGDFFDHLDGITHWMPLPELPTPS